MKTTEYFKALDNRGRMVHGGLVFDREGKPFIGTVHLLTQVNPKTVCRNTGITDSNGKDIYENDILRLYYGERPHIAEVEYIDGCFMVDGDTLLSDFLPNNIKIVGTNITDYMKDFYEEFHDGDDDYILEEYL